VGVILSSVSCRSPQANLRNLTEAEKARAVEIALATDEAQAQVKQGITYKSDQQWIGISKGFLKATELNVFDYDAWEKGVPENLPSSAVIYPYVSLTFGEPERLLIMVAVDLESGKAVWVDSMGLKSLPRQ
jgi:hypothetical protein